MDNRLIFLYIVRIVKAKLEQDIFRLSPFGDEKEKLQVKVALDPG